MELTVHELKTWPEHYRNMACGEKKVEIRSEHDRCFKKDDILRLREWNPHTKKYTGASMNVKVTHCLRGYPWVPKGYVAMSISPIYLEELEVQQTQ